MNKKIMIIGAGQTGGMVASILQECGHRIVGFVDDRYRQLMGKANTLPILGDRRWLIENKASYDAICLGVGTITARQSLCAWIEEHDLPTVSAIHPSVIMSPEVVLGDNLVIGAGSVLYINPRIGEGCFIGPSVTVSHDTVVGDYCLLSVGSIIGARCDLGERVLIGSGATLMPPGFSQDARLSIGDRSIVGVGSTVIRDVAKGTTVIGSPAKILRKNTDD